LGPGGSLMYSMRPTLMYNGYEAFVSELYTGKESWPISRASACRATG